MPQLAQGANTTLTMGVTDIVTIISNGGEYRVEQPAGTLLAIVGYTKTFGPFPTGGSLKITANLGSVLYDQATLRSNLGYVYLDSDSALKASGTAVNVGAALGPFTNINQAPAAASNIGKHASVGSVAPYVDYVSNGGSWIVAGPQPAFSWGITANADALASNVMASPPTFAISVSNAATALAGSPVLLDNNNAVFTYSPGSPSAGALFWPSSGGYILGSNNFVGCQTDALDFELLAFANSGSTLNVRVNGKFVSATGLVASGTSGVFRVRLTFATRALRRIELTGDACADSVAFRGINLFATDYVGPLQAQSSELWGIVGDNMSAGGTTFGGYSSDGAGGLMGSCLTALGVRNYVALTVGGSGYIAGGTNAFTTSVPAKLLAVGAPLTRFLLVGGVNDMGGGYTTAAITTAVNAVFDAIRAAYPAAKILAVTTLTNPAAGDNASLGIVAAAAGRDYVSVIRADGRYVSGTGRVGATTGVGNRDLVISADNTNPSPYGHVYIGMRLAQDILALRAVSP